MTSSITHIVRSQWLDPTSITDAHRQEWLESRVHPDIIELNVRSLSGQMALELITEEAIASMQREFSYVSTGVAKLLKRYEHLENGGWWVSQWR
jgi:hypothetical protein